MRLIGGRCKYSNVFSRAILMGDSSLRNLQLIYSVFRVSFKENIGNFNVGDSSGAEQPLPIPNREVKHSSAENIALATK